MNNAGVEGETSLIQDAIVEDFRAVSSPEASYISGTVFDVDGGMSAA